MSDTNRLAVSAEIKSVYDEQYIEASSEWRLLGGKYKARHIVDLCQRQNIVVDTLLEVGAGEGAILYHLHEQGFCDIMDAIEISQSGVDLINQRSIPSMRRVQVFDGYQIPYDADSFDLVILSHVLEHVEFPRLLLREIWRVARHLVIEVPCDYSPDVDTKVDHFLSYGHLGIYTPPLLRFLLRTEGFDIVDDITSLTATEVIEYMLFDLEKRPRTRFQIQRLRWRLRLRDWLYFRAEREKRDRLANAYTALCRKGNRPSIF